MHIEDNYLPLKLSKLTEELFGHLYTDVLEFRKAFNLPIGVSSLSEDADDLHTSLAVEELSELAEASDPVAQADAIVDTIYVLVGRLVHLGHHRTSSNNGISYSINLLLNVAERLKINFLPCWDEVHRSNMSKICLDKVEYQQTEKFYAQMGIKTEPVLQGKRIVVRCAEDFADSGTVIIHRGKIMKSIHYRPANLKKFFKEV